MQLNSIQSNSTQLNPNQNNNSITHSEKSVSKPFFKFYFAVFRRNRKNAGNKGTFTQKLNLFIS
jgi:hypothetical protein